MALGGRWRREVKMDRVKITLCPSEEAIDSSCVCIHNRGNKGRRIVWKRNVLERSAYRCLPHRCLILSLSFSGETCPKKNRNYVFGNCLLLLDVLFELHVSYVYSRHKVPD
ncbi:hypothetical protein NPIL_420421 [Nephila pilipes]|uniref:Uncharacterized protein n=1 Tax=Nephila pilipes TaxID=299642 RepID=A0A8X6IT94_NEPPI|nr:hypothetical protein NPIL_420421 [Nephila pilipes]